MAVTDFLERMAPSTEPAGSSGDRAVPLPRGRQPGWLPTDCGGAKRDRTSRAAGGAERLPLAPAASEQAPPSPREDGIQLRRAKLSDVPGIASVMTDYVIAGTLLPRPTSELYQWLGRVFVAFRELEVRLLLGGIAPQLKHSA